MMRNALLIAAIVAVQSTHDAAAQCQRWAPIYGGPGGEAWALELLDTGSGPQVFLCVENRVRKWTGTSWTAPGNEDFDDTVYSLGVYDSGAGPTLYAGGLFSSTLPSQGPAFRIAQLVNGVWSQVGGGLPVLGGVGGMVLSMTAFDDGAGSRLFVGGFIQTSLVLNSNSILKWDGTAWSGVGGGTSGSVSAMCAFDDGSGPALFVGGNFLTAGGVTVNHIAKWNGATWMPLGSGLSFSLGSGGAGAMTVFDDGSGPALYVAGVFDHAGGVPADSVAKWDGSAWHALPGLTGTPYLVCVSIEGYDDGNGPALYVGLNPTADIGSDQVHGIARWDGTGWSSLGNGFIGSVRGLTSFDDGQGAGPALWVAGTSTGYIGGSLPGSNVARWYGGCHHRIDPLCFGDGSYAPCPCFNFGTSLHGCRNSSSSQGALLSSFGTLSPDTLVLQSSVEPATSPSLFLQGSALRPVQAILGDGILCLGGSLLRMYTKYAVGGVAQAPQPTDPSITQRSAALGDPLAPGTVRYYQVLYRDNHANWCPPSNFNLSNGLRVVW